MRLDPAPLTKAKRKGVILSYSLADSASAGPLSADRPRLHRRPPLRPRRLFSKRTTGRNGTPGD